MDCDNSYMDGCETDTSMNINNCGGCNRPCSIMHAQPACMGGQCVIDTCFPGWGDCNHSVVDGCEMPVNGNDNNNCGACGRVCAPQNGTGSCMNGVCTITSCNNGFADCDHDPNNGCESNTSSDPNNCGRCGGACSSFNGTPTCTNGVCGINCNPGYGNCDGSAANGCEVHTDTDPNNCGGCNLPCVLQNASAACVGGNCAIASCAGGFANCDGVVGNGCETNTTNDVQNCSTCNAVCPGYLNPTDDAFCTGSSCDLTCRGENYDVNNNPVDGCEVYDGNGPGHSTATATYLGQKECLDSTSNTTVTGDIPSDSRVHNPPVESFNGSMGAAPDYFSVFGTGSCSGFLCVCVNDFQVTITTSGGGGSQCYQVTLITNNGNHTMTVSGSGTNTMSGGAGSYGNNTTLYIVIEKICTLPVQENVAYTVNFHL
jgi:hypothetical protein